MHRTARIVALTEATSTVAHELNQPLVAIVGYNAACMRLLERGRRPGGVREAMEQVPRAGGARGRDPEADARAHVAAATPEFVACDVNAMVRDALAWVEHDLERAHVAVALRSRAARCRACRPTAS